MGAIIPCFYDDVDRSYFTKTWDFRIESQLPKLTEKQRLQVLYNVARALRERHSEGTSYGNLSIENVVIEEGVFKLSSYSDNFDKDDRYKGPEYFTDHILSSQSLDIWAFGILIWDVMFPNHLHPIDDYLLRDRSIQNYYEASCKLTTVKFPANDYSELCSLMNQCLSKTASSRPTAIDLCQKISTYL